MAVVLCLCCGVSHYDITPPPPLSLNTQVTPQSIRMRKRELDSNRRLKLVRDKSKAK